METGGGGVVHPTTRHSTVRQKRLQNVDARHLMNATNTISKSEPSIGPAGMSLSLPVNGSVGSARDSSTSTSPRRAVSPLLEVRRPHCTLNCDHCNAILEDRFKHLSKILIVKLFWKKSSVNLRSVEEVDLTLSNM